ncbi:MAG: hypothetical protein P4L99_02600 [Chthoniobacter sp.]|nr:hypothetical protein [Chthoniobacter sp.]
MDSKPEQKPEFVKVRDLLTGKISTVSSEGLPPGMIAVPYRNEVVWIDREQLQVVKMPPKSRQP